MKSISRAMPARSRSSRMVMPEMMSGTSTVKPRCVSRHPTAGSCEPAAAHNAYECVGGQHRQLVLEDVTHHSMERRIAPVALLVDGYVSLATGPQNYAISYVTKTVRLNTFWLTGVLLRTHDIHFTSTTPERLRLHLRELHAQSGAFVLLPARLGLVHRLPLVLIDLDDVLPRAVRLGGALAAVGRRPDGEGALARREPVRRGRACWEARPPAVRRQARQAAVTVPEALGREHTRG